MSALPTVDFSLTETNLLDQELSPFDALAAGRLSSVVAMVIGYVETII